MKGDLAVILHDEIRGSPEGLSTKIITTFLSLQQVLKKQSNRHNHH
jgi:hypothetical protein